MDGPNYAEQGKLGEGIAVFLFVFSHVFVTALALKFVEMLLRFFAANSTQLKPNNDEIVAPEGVTFSAKLALFTLRVRHIFAMRERLKMRTANAWKILAPMVKFFSFGNGAYCKLVSDDVRALENATTNGHVAVAEGLLGCGPHPATAKILLAARKRTAFIYLVPEALDNIFAKTQHKCYQS